MPERRGGRCDLCNKGLKIGEMVYTHSTPSTGTFEEAERGEAFWIEDPEWAVCQECEDHLKSYDAGVISEHAWIFAQAHRSLEHQQMIVIGMTNEELWELRNEQVKHILKVVAGFIQNRTPEVTSEPNPGIG